MFDLHTVRLPHLWREEELRRLAKFMRGAAFVVCHKNEPIANLWRVLWYLPATSHIIVSTNCDLDAFDALKAELRDYLPHHQLHVVHQKDPDIAAFFATQGVTNILGADGRVVNGKGEGMYIGTLIAKRLGARWLAFFDADNLAPAILLAFITALARLFLPRHAPPVELHNVRIFWHSKPDVNNPSADSRQNAMGRCSRVIAPLFDILARTWFGEQERNIITPNAGEQAFTMHTLAQMRFSSAFTIETFLLLELLHQARGDLQARLDQYLSQSPFFHTKKDDDHIDEMIGDSLSSFLPFWEALPAEVQGAIDYIRRERNLKVVAPAIYPALNSLELGDFDITPYHLGEANH